MKSKLMNNKDLYIKLKDAYSDENLNKVTAKIIELYKSRQYDEIREIIRIVSEYIDINDDRINRCFSKLIMIYHPDKGNQYRKEIDGIYRSGKIEMLTRFSHILTIQDIEAITMSEEFDPDIDYTPQYEWDYDNSGYEYFYDYDEEPEHDLFSFYDEETDNSFFSVVKRKLYGNMDIDMPPYYLEDLEEIEMAEYEIDYLDGIHYCKHVKNLDLSRNNITDITDIVNLISLEELYLSDNQIGFIDAIYNLRRLRIVDLSNNNIDDLSPLFKLENLEYVNIIGNNIPKDQIERLKQKEIIVIF